MSARIEETQCRWDDFFLYNPASRHRRRIILKLIRNLSFTSLLDVGCGNGQLLDFLSQEIAACRQPTFRIAGAELNRKEAPDLIRKLNGRFYPLDLEREAIEETFDLVVASEVIEHIAQDQKAVEHLAEMCRRWIVVTVPSGTVYPSDKAMGHVRHYTTDSLRALMEAGGFKTLSCFAWGFPFHSLYRILLNRGSSSALAHFGKDRYDVLQKALCQGLYAAFYVNWRGAGQQLFYLGERR